LEIPNPVGGLNKTIGHLHKVLNGWWTRGSWLRHPTQ
jgi:hypothetical protein